MNNYKLKFACSLLTLMFLLSCGLFRNEQSTKQEEQKKPDDTQNKTKELSVNKKSLKEIVADAKKKFNEYSPKIEKDHDGTLNSIEAYTGDFTNDGLEDVAIYFTLNFTGGNGLKWVGISFYKNDGSEAKVIAGFEPNYNFTFDRISEGKIFITKQEYKKDDPRCCPSIHTPIKLTITGNKVSEELIDK